MPTRKCRHTTLAALVALLLISTQLARAQTGNGALKVTSFPTGAHVVVDGADTGKTTPMIVSLPLGDHTVVVSLPNTGWSPDTRTVTVVSGNNDLSVTLPPLLTVGPQGPIGPKGDKGDSGAQGLQGLPGPLLENTAIGSRAMINNTSGCRNTAVGYVALDRNGTGCGNTAIGWNANVTSTDLTNATAIGFDAKADASNKIRLGNAQVTVLEAQVGLTVMSDRNQKEGFRPVDGEDVLTKIRHMDVPSWNYVGHDARQFRHYGPMAQDFYAAFGHDGVGAVGTPTTITSTDVDGILMIALQAVEQRTEQLRRENDLLKAALDELRAELRTRGLTARCRWELLAQRPSEPLLRRNARKARTTPWAEPQRAFWKRAPIGSAAKRTGRFTWPLHLANH